MASRNAKRRLRVSALAAALILGSAALLLFVYTGTRSSPVLIQPGDDAMRDLPRVILWAWERPEDLRFINPDEIGVAFLAETILLRGDRTVIRPRLQPLRLAPATRRIAVARIETDGRRRPLFSDDQRNRIVAEMIALARGENVAAIQIDFDALKSERAFYRALLIDLRRQLPAATRLSITALASWCLGDNWIADLPVDEAVPMLFRMGADDQNVRMRLAAGAGFSVPAARHSIGISTDERPDRLPGVNRVYVFNPRAWSAASVSQIIREVQAWQ